MRAFGAKLDDPNKDRFSAVRLVENPHDPTPNEVDYSYGFTIDDQGDLGTCVAYGTRKLFDFFATKRTGKPFLVSPRAIYAQAKLQFEPDDLKDDGLAVSYGLTVAQEFYVNESDYPSTDNTSEADFPQWIAPVPMPIRKNDFLLKDVVRLAKVTPEQIELALHQHGPLLIGTQFLADWENIGSDGMMPVNGGASLGGHCMAITSYCRNFRGTGRSVVKLANNWTPQWGDAGYGYLPYEAIAPNITDAYTVRA